jgi:hypothetical protein
MSLKSALCSMIYQTDKWHSNSALPCAEAVKWLADSSWYFLSKSGTHLLDRILLGFSKVAPFAKRVHSFYVEYKGENGLKRSPEQASAWLDSLRPRDMASAHLFTSPKLLPAFACQPSSPIPFFATRAMGSSHPFLHHQYGSASCPSK